MKDWWQSEIIYQIYPKSFRDSNGDGIGDLNGITDSLDYLTYLGITMIWISPIFKSPMADNGYDISDYFDIAPEYGTMDDFKRLLAEARKRGIKIVLDLVVNHTSDEHKWFQKALKDKHSKYRDYYIFKESKELPNNWRSVFGGSVWEKVPNEEVYYYHTFHKKQPDLNWENPLMREEIYKMVNCWLDLGISGFRVDAITFIKKDLSYRDITPDGVDGLGKCTRASRNQAGIEVFLNELKERCFVPHNAVTIAEAPGVDYSDLEQFIGDDGFFSMIFDFKAADLDVASGSEWFKRVNWTKRTLFELLRTSQRHIQKHGWGAPFIENHDQNRAPDKYLKQDKENNEALKALALVYFYLYGTPFIYQGQEIGMINAHRHSIREFDDISSVDQYYRGIAEGLSAEESLSVINYRSRDNSRVPMQWDDSQYVGFSTVEPWLPICEQSPIRNIAAQLEDKDSLLQFYRSMIALKKAYPALMTGKISFLETDSDDIFAYQRYLDKDSFSVIVNLSANRRTIRLDMEGEILLDNYQGEWRQGELDLPPYRAVLIKEKKDDRTKL
ncbi:alpha-glucosidase [Streptococcus sp. zg-JUN1979]|uniref:alpha-glucosidase n=1 Tax=Streptococcus sp. zg-JUN1979 TaxID=3391450 RepID=UPI0039A621AE